MSLNVLPYASPSISARFHAMDALRAVAMLLGIFLHGAISYMHSRPPWWPGDPYQNLGYDLMVFVIHAFRMELFFMMAGFFGHLLYMRYGRAEFIRHRLLRIGAPLVMGWVLMVIFISLILRGTQFQEIAFRLYHLWFLYYLLILYGGVLLLDLTIGRFIGEGFWAQADRLAAFLARSPFQCLLCALFTLPALSLMRTAVVEPPLDLVPQVPLILYYGVYFAFGWMLHRQPELLQQFSRWRWLSTAMALLLTLPVVALEMHIVESEKQLIEVSLAMLIFTRALYAIYTWSLVFAVSGFFVRHLAHPSPAMRYLADAAYWLYLVHLPLILFLQIRLVDSPIPGPLRFPIVIIVSLSILLLSYHFCVRYTWIGWLLNGPRSRPAASPDLGTSSAERFADKCAAAAKSADLATGQMRL